MSFADNRTSGKVVFRWALMPAVITLASDCCAGDLLGYSSGWKKADPNNATLIQPRCVASTNGAIGDSIIAYFGNCYIEGKISGATIGSALYSDPAVPGGITETASTTPTDGNTVIGLVVGSTDCILTPNANADSVAT